MRSHYHICDDCNLSFTTSRTLAKAGCPKCMDHIAVRQVKANSRPQASKQQKKELLHLFLRRISS